MAFVVASVLLVSMVSAAPNIDSVEIKSLDVAGNDVSVTAGEVIPVKVVFTANENASDVTIEAELEGKRDSEAEVFVGNVEDGKKYVKTFNMRVPSDLQDEVSDDLQFNLEISNEDFSVSQEHTLRLQRASYNVGIMSVSTSQSVNAGELFPVDVVLKNTGYEDLDDLYVTVSVEELGIQKEAFFGDLVSIEDDDNDDTVRGRLFLEVPEYANSGMYNMEVSVNNEDLSLNKVQELKVTNGLFENIIASGNKMIFVNPSNNVKVLKLVSEDSSVSLSEDVVTVPAGSSRTVTADGSGEFKVNVLTLDGNVVDSVTLQGSEGGTASNAVTVLTVILTVVFLVLLVVLIVLVTRKQEKPEEFGESYY